MRDVQARPPVVEPTATGGPAATASLAAGLAVLQPSPSSNPVHPAILPAVLFVVWVLLVTLHHAPAVRRTQEPREARSRGKPEAVEVRAVHAYDLVGPKNGRSGWAVGREISQPQTEGWS